MIHRQDDKTSKCPKDLSSIFVRLKIQNEVLFHGFSLSKVKHEAVAPQLDTVAPFHINTVQLNIQTIAQCQTP